ncbi:MAG: COX15/CtaA family protein, partial [Gemmatimonadota bacterium]|nr:COX15/CtaA family protein [Gemmatimonadota bacterium]
TDGAAQTLHWTHRIFAFLFTFHAFGMVMGARRRSSIVMRRATATLFGIILLQIVIAAILVFTYLPPVLQSLHQAVGTLVWLAALVTAGLAVRGFRRAHAIQPSSSTLSTLSTLSTPSTPRTQLP